MSAGQDDLIGHSLEEDLGERGDVTSQAFIPATSESNGRIIARGTCIASGLSTAEEVFRRVDPSLKVSLSCTEGDLLAKGTTLLEVSGSTRSILSAERTVLNFLGRLCGIATLSRQYADIVVGTKVQLLDTRKTTPGWRLLEKQAVKAGGCVNHLAALGDLSLLPPIIGKLRSEHPCIPIEIEADRLDQVQLLLAMPGIDVILLDNMPLETMVQAVKLRDSIAPGILLEACGGVTLNTLLSIADTGVDRISVGALTHSVMNVDLSLELA